MRHLLSAVLLAASANIDNLGVGLAYGVVGRKIRLHANLLIALVSGGGTLLAMAIGEWVNDFLAEEIAEVLGGVIMIALGLITVALAMRASQRRPIAAEAASAPAPPASVVGAREAIILAVSLTFNNLGVGLGAGISHVSIPLTTGFTMVASVATIVAGRHLGRHAAATISKRWLGVASGLMIVGVGIYECFV